MKRVMLTAAIAATLGVTAVASAQNTDYTPHNFSFRLGTVFPLDHHLRDVNKTFLAIGADYKFNTQYLKNGETYFSLDYIAKAWTGEKGTMWPLMINQRFMGKDGSYWSLGAGAVNMNFSKSDTVFGARFGVGKNLGESIFVEGAFLWSDKSRGNVRATSLGFYIGYRF